MISGSILVLTWIHVVLSLVALGSGFKVLLCMRHDPVTGAWTTLFLATAAATSLTGFLFPTRHVEPAHLVGVISLLAWLAALIALRVLRLRGAARAVYALSCVFLVYLDAFVAVVQAFQKIPPLQRLSSPGGAPAMAFAQLALAGGFVWLALRVLRGLASAGHPERRDARAE